MCVCVCLCVSVCVCLFVCARSPPSTSAHFRNPPPRSSPTRAKVEKRRKNLGDPRTVMIHLEHARAADGAVVGPRRLWAPGVLGEWSAVRGDKLQPGPVVAYGGKGREGRRGEGKGGEVGG